ncbi:MAG: saccharopine dehydrogenase NADP-binding domain-containing protein, partial [Sphingopyxis sp.]
TATWGAATLRLTCLCDTRCWASWCISTLCFRINDAVSLTVLIIGASGVFGSRLAMRCAREPGVRLILAGRRADALRALGAQIDPDAIIRTLDRDHLAASDFAGADLVVDAAGPFQASQDAVIRAAIGAGIPYLDLADGRAFVAAIGQYDSAARARGIAILTGASSVPALSHAVIDDLVKGWSRIDDLRVGIFPGNRAPRGLSVMQAILSYVGKPVSVWREGRWQDVPGWGMTHRWRLSDGTRRWASVCDTPDQDLLVARYNPTRSAEFFAGLELPLLHLGLALLAWPVRLGIVRSLRPFARSLLWAAQRFLRWGSDVGYMEVHARGLDAKGNKAAARWTLRASGNCGPTVPTLAALALIRRYRDGNPPLPGARACAGELALAEFAGDFEELGIKTRIIPSGAQDRGGTNPSGVQEQIFMDEAAAT